MAERLFVLLNAVQSRVVFHVQMVQYCGEVGRNRAALAALQ